MRKKLANLVLIGIILAATVTLAQQTRQAEIDLQAAIRTETVKGDLKDAIKQYEAIVSKYQNDRAVVATALVHMAESYLKLGDTESKKIFERVVREYADQKDAVSVATARLNGKISSPGMTSREVWGGPEVDTYGTVSPDGRYITFVAPCAFRGIPVANVAPCGLGVHDIRTGINRQVDGRDVIAGGEIRETGESVISKDGKLIVYTVFNEKQVRYQLRLANVEGNPNPRLLFDNPEVNWIAAYDWTPDNKSAVVLLKRKDRTAQIGLVSIPEGSLRILKSVDWRGTGRIFLTPDGKYMGYDLAAPDTNREHDIFVLSTDGSRENTAVSHPSLNFMVGWSPDGKWLFFASNRTGSMSLWAAPFVDGKVQGPPELIRADIGRVESMGMTRSGSFYFGVRHDPGVTSNIQVASLESGSSSVSGVSSIPKEQGASDKQPSWSPDGDFLAYLSDRGSSGSSVEQSGERTIVLVIRSSETMRTVQEFDLNLSGNVRLNHWTPDGTGLLFTGQDGKGRPGLFRVDARSGTMSVVGLVNLKPGEWDDGDWKVSSDGAALFLRHSDCDVTTANQGCVVPFIRRDLASGAETKLISGQVGYVNLSPNDTYIATPVLDPTTNSRTFVAIPTAGGRPIELMRLGETGPHKPGGLSFLGWAPDSRSVFIREGMDGKPIAVWRASVDGTPAQKLNWSSGQFAEGVAMHPKGNKLAYLSPTIRSTPPAKEVWVLENFIPTAKANR